MEEDERKCFTCGFIGHMESFMLINEGYECLECSEENRTEYENRKLGRLDA
jgi:DNA-directed RNA polymerase subunit RPC12/RpoP|tara:strand:- start:469 stop:621 length:153 start_codon:yes stop_codon:yes gene_type:complete